MKTIQPKLILVISAILIATVFRMLPHWYGFTPLTAIALMGGALVADKRLAFAIPVLAMFVSDLVTVTFLNSYWTTPAEYFLSSSTAFLYIAVLAMTAIGFWLRKRMSTGKLAIAAGSGSIVFFLLSNFGVWMINELPKSFGGLMGTYALGLPFLTYELAGSLFYSFVFFGAFRLVCSSWPADSRKVA